MATVNFVLTIFAAGLATAGSAMAEPACRTIDDAGARYTLCAFDARRTAIRVFLRDPQGEIIGSFSRLEQDLRGRGETLAFAMNAGMYDTARAPVGLFVEDGKTQHPANTRPGAGNFHMKPNGVFFVADGRAGVMETGRFLRSGIKATYATQSGPLLVGAGRINPHIHDSGLSEKIRNGVGVAGHEVKFVISDQPVTFHAFAHLFRERLGCPDALFLDGSVSSLYAPALGRHDRFMPMGPIVGVVEKRK